MHFPIQVLHGAHAKDCEITSLAFSKDNSTLLSRAADDTLKVDPQIHPVAGGIVRRKVCERLQGHVLYSHVAQDWQSAWAAALLL